MIDPMRQYTKKDFSESTLPLAALVSGSFKSAFTGTGIVPQTAQSPETRIVVAGDGDFMRDDFVSNHGNMAFFENVVDYLADDAGLVTIRSKDTAQPPLEQVSDATKQTIKWTNMIVPPIAVLFYGLFRWRNRKAWKKMLEQQSV
jgi:ABC-type uncharacterized transport system involved in gliding motility auxiliary subunit